MTDPAHDAAKSIQLPDGAVPIRRLANWTEIELRTPTAGPTSPQHQQQQPIQPFSPPSTIPEHGRLGPHQFSPHSRADASEPGEPSLECKKDEACDSGEQTHLAFHQSTLGSLLLHDALAANRIPETGSVSSGISTRVPLNPFEQAAGGRPQYRHEPPSPPPKEPASGAQSSPETVTLPVQQTPLESISQSATKDDDQLPQRTTSASAVMKELSPAAWKRHLSLKSVWRHPPTDLVETGGGAMTTQTTTNNHQPPKGLFQTLFGPALSKVHPLQLTTGVRVFLIYPLVIYLMFQCIVADDWRHLEIKYALDPGIKSRTTLSLTGVQRLTETETDRLSAAAAASVRELPVSYQRVMKSMGGGSAESFCDRDIQAAAAEQLLGSLSVKQAIDGSHQNPRLTRLALYHILHGPTFRDVDCRQLKAFQHGGRVALGLIAFAMAMAIVEWAILVLHLTSRRRAKEAEAALSFNVKRSPNPYAPPTPAPAATTTFHPDSEASPPFLCHGGLPATVTAPPQMAPSRRGPDRDLSWAFIDLSGRNASGADRRRPPFRGLRIAARRLKERFVGVEQAGPANEGVRQEPATCCGLFSSPARPPARVCIMGETAGADEKFRLSDWMWWSPLGFIQRCVGWKPRRSGRTVFFCASFLGGSTLFLSIASLSALILAIVTWMGATSQPACLNEATELRICRSGRGLKLLIFSIGFVLGCVWLHLKTPLICSQIAQVKQKHINSS